MSDLNDPLKDSYISKVGDALKPYSNDLKAKGFDPASIITRLTGAGELIEGADKLSTAAQKSATDAIQHVQDLRTQFYTQATSTVSLVEGLLGKDHELTGKLRSLRRDLIGNQHPGGASVPAPAGA